MLPLFFYVGLSLALMLADQHAGYGRIARQRLSLLTTPLWLLASSPQRLYRGASEEFALRGSLEQDNRRKTRALAIAEARIRHLDAIAAENVRLRALLGGARGYSLDVRLVGVIDVDLDPSKQRLVLDGGSADGVQVGQALIDAGGVLGQVIEVTEHRAIALLVTDPDHAVPVQVARTGLRTTAYGTGSSGVLALPDIPQSADIREGDLLITSGIGGRFPAGFPVGVVRRLHADKLRLFVVGEATPSAHLDRGNEVLLVSNLPADPDIGPPAPQGANTANLAATAALMAPPTSIAPATPAKIPATPAKNPARPAKIQSTPAKNPARPRR
jgi:rod shape-determining protein MreC